MDAKLQRRVQRYGWDAAAKSYEASWQDHLRPAHALLLDRADIQPGESVLDVACGTGLITIPAARAVGSTGHVLATDISEEMVVLTQNAVGAAGLKNVRVARMDAELIDFPDAQFQVALCALGLMYMPNPSDALGEMKRMLKRSGRAVAAVWGDRRKCGWKDVFPVVDSVVQSDVCPLFFRLGAEHVLSDEFRAAGFGEIDECKIDVTTKIASVEHLYRAFLDSGPVALAVKRFDSRTRNKVEGLFLSSVREFQAPDGSFHIPGEFVVVSGRRRQ